MIDEDKLDLRTIASIVKAATTGGHTTQFAMPAHRLAFGTEAARSTAKSAVDAAVEALLPKAGPPPPELSGIDAIKLALRTALRLEFATIPPYLTALWSIIDQAHPVAISIRAIAHEEMLHLSLLCNLLSALDERPSLTGEAVPRFPSRLPSGVHPEIELRLEGFGPRTLDTFMEIERPKVAIPIEGEPLETFPPEDVTIGEFYEELLQGINRLNPPLDARRQIAGPFTWFVMTKLGDVEQAIKLIMAQGEGASGVPFPKYKHHLSHYYRFKSLKLLTKLEWDEDAKLLRKKDQIPAPAVFTLAPPSPEGYGPAAPRELRTASNRFENTYSQMLRLLEESWLEGGDKSFLRALELMFELGPLAQTIMRIGTPDGRGYCPSFRYLP
ncbi:ferritin-like domain-containing protein [Ideonella sp. YS5]|uniref:ferritin-like domain-containing protein n=1 Tax=Ideonella sp. YS5 TaxID=3453714 RepID=UPI003EE99929